MFRRKKKDITPALTWYDISLGDFLKIKNLDMKDFDDQIEAAVLLLGIDEGSMKWSEFCQEVKKLDFMKEPIPEVLVRNQYILNGRKYDCLYDLQGLNVSRYMDFITLMKEEDKDLVKILGVFLVPAGKKYLEGYDIDQVYEDIRSMCVVDAYGIFNFFWVQFRVCIGALKDYSVKNLKSHPELAKAVSDLMDSYCMLGL